VAEQRGFFCGNFFHAVFRYRPRRAPTTPVFQNALVRPPPVAGFFARVTPPIVASLVPCFIGIHLFSKPQFTGNPPIWV